MPNQNPETTAKLAGHPIHPMLVPFPIAFFVAAFICDLVVWRTGDPGWSTTAHWLIGAGLVTAALAALAGLTDFLGERRIRALNDAWLHAGGNVIVVLLEAWNWYARYRGGPAVVVPTGLLLSLAAVGLLLFTGWKGGELVFRHRVGVTDQAAAEPARDPRHAR
jgi:uncharacterized membrane protein